MTTGASIFFQDTSLHDFLNMFVFVYSGFLLDPVEEGVDVSSVCRIQTKDNTNTMKAMALKTVKLIKKTRKIKILCRAK